MTTEVSPMKPRQSSKSGARPTRLPREMGLGMAPKYDEDGDAGDQSGSGQEHRAAGPGTRKSTAKTSIGPIA